MADEDEYTSFHMMGLDDRLLKAIAQLGWSQPTPIQEKAIPLALEGKDILSRARTGSGKTAAFTIPILQKILEKKKFASEQCVCALILTPTKELCNQAHKKVLELTNCCSREVKCVDISAKVPLLNQRPMLMENPDIVIGTPSRVLAHTVAGNVAFRDTLEYLVIDEADLVFSFGYESDIKQLMGHLPKIYQAFLMSATLSEDVKSLKKMVLHNAVILKLEESQLPSTTQLQQYHIKCEEEDKFALLAALLKLGLVRGKSILFVKSVDRCYKIKLFLQQFGISCCVLNSELPQNSRCHIVSQFNEGLYNYIIASDERHLTDPKQTIHQQTTGKKSHRKQDTEYGVSRGIDFQNVSNIVNFDFPTTVEAYIHRVGRTARGDNHGTALSFVSVKEMEFLAEVEKSLSSKSDADGVFKPYNFKMDQIEGFRYRAKDAMKSVTRVSIREARLKEIRREMLTSEKLRSHFEDNPRDAQVLRHDRNLETVKHSQHLKHVPDYIVPETLQTMAKRGNQKHTGSHPINKKFAHRPQGQHKSKKRKADPLKSFEFAGLRQPKKKRK